MNKYLLFIIILIMSHNSFAYERITNLITPVSYFVNHIKQLNSLKNNLSKYRQVSIVGLSGMGKTQIARMYAYENKSNYNIIWFFDCNLDLNNEFLKLAKTLNKLMKANISEDTMLAKQEVMNYLTHQNKWLLVFDNLKVNDNKRIQDLVNWEHNGNVIFCSQDSEMLPHTIEMTAFNKEDAVTLASNLLKSKDKSDINFLVKEFGGYPIFIVQGAQLLNKIKGLDRKEYKNKIHQSTDKIMLNITIATNELNPSARKLLDKITLINNQSFSKEFLGFISNDITTLDDDIYQLSKFVLISNTNSNEQNPIFEMHDVIAQKILEVNADKNKLYLEDIITRLMNSIPKSVLKGRIFRSARTVSENLEVILKNAERYNINIYKIMALNHQLIIQYVNSLDYYNAEKQVDWFNKNDKKEQFKLWLMNNDEKSKYAAYLGMIGNYYKNRYSDYNKTIKYLRDAKTVFDDVKGYESYKFNIICQLVTANATLGYIQDAQQNLGKLEEMLNANLVDKSDISFTYMVKARLLFVQGKYIESLEQVEQYIGASIKNGLDINDLFFTNPYMLKAEILNAIGKYQEAYAQIEQLYEMHKPVKREDHEIFGRIYTQMAKSELGLGKIDTALEHVTESIAIFLADEKRNPKDADYSEDPDLAASYVVQGDIFFVQDNFKQAIESYKKAQIIYFYLYRDRSKNVAHVSYLYTQGAKVAYKAKDLYNYKAFGKPQVKEFGVDHPKYHCHV